MIKIGSVRTEYNKFKILRIEENAERISGDIKKPVEIKRKKSNGSWDKIEIFNGTTKTRDKMKSDDEIWDICIDKIRIYEFRNNSSSQIVKKSRS